MNINRQLPNLRATSNLADLLVRGGVRPAAVNYIWTGRLEIKQKLVNNYWTNKLDCDGLRINFKIKNKSPAGPHTLPLASSSRQHPTATLLSKVI